MNDIPHGFILSDAALYAFQDQDIYPDILSFCVAIPDHLKPLFLIPIQIETSPFADVASRVSSHRYADGPIPTGDTEEADLFAVKTFVYDDDEPLIPEDDPGSIFDMDTGYEKTHHQEYHFDENIQSPTDTSYMSDVDITQYQKYPYRTDEKPVRHSSTTIPYPVLVRLAISPDDLENRTPAKIKENAETCTVQFISFDKRDRVYSFTATCGTTPRNVRASMSDPGHVAIICDCPFWQWNGPEFHAAQNDYILGDPYGTASPPDVRDPDRKYWLCKHAYAVIIRLDHYVQEIVDENPHIAADESALMDEIDSDWDRLEGVAEIPLDEMEELEEAEIEWEEPGEEPPEGAVPVEPEEPEDLGEFEYLEPAEEEPGLELELEPEPEEELELEPEPEEELEPELEPELEEEPEPEEEEPEPEEEPK